MTDAKYSALAIIAVLIAGATAAHADGLRVRTIENGSWPAAVAALQADVNGDGRVVHVFVRDDSGRPVACGSYTLVLDPIGSQAFAIGDCDGNTTATAVRLEHRHALFAHEDIVPTPLAAGITAIEVRSGGARGGAGSTGGSELVCSVALRPFLTDMENGRRVFLQPGRFVLRLQSSQVAADVGPDEWLLRTSTRGTLTVVYDVFDRMRNEVVLHQQTTLSCGTRTADVSVPDRAAPTSVPTLPAMDFSAAPEVREIGTRCANAPLLVSGARAMGTTMGGARRPLYRIEVPRGAVFALSMNSNFGGEVDLYSGCPDLRRPITESDVFGGGTDERHRWNLAGGTYYLAIVDADVHQHDGAYALTTESTASLLALPDIASPDANDTTSSFLRAHPDCRLAGAFVMDGVVCRSRESSATN